MVSYNKEVVVEVPHRVSGFFEIVDEIDGIKLDNPERIGSRGAGFNLSAVGRTKIRVEKMDGTNDHKINIFINNEKVNEKAETTYFVYTYIKKYIENGVKISIFHEFDLPVGCGFGASGSGALGSAFGLNYVLNLGLTLLERGKIAHIAEVVNRTGLGTVCGQLRGGLCILKEPGYPCISESINVPERFKIICGSFGMIHTKSILTDPVLNRKIKLAGRRAQAKLLNDRNIKSFIKASIDFVEETQILEILGLNDLKDLIQSLNNLNILGASMNQLGRSVFAICKEEKVSIVREIMNSYKPEIKIFNLTINPKGPYILNNT